MSELTIEKAFVAYWNAQAFGLPTAYEGEDFTPSQGTAYASIRLFPNETIGDTLADLDGSTGFFQFTLRYPQGQGAIPAKAMRQTIFDAFPVGARIPYNGIALDISAKIPFIAEDTDGWYEIVGRINYSVKLNRQ